MPPLNNSLTDLELIENEVPDPAVLLDLIEELRSCLRYDEPCSLETEVETTIRAAIKQLEYIIRYLKQVQ